MCLWRSVYPQYADSRSRRTLSAEPVSLWAASAWSLTPVRCCSGSRWIWWRFCWGVARVWWRERTARSSCWTDGLRAELRDSQTSAWRRFGSEVLALLIPDHTDIHTRGEGHCDLSTLHRKCSLQRRGNELKVPRCQQQKHVFPAVTTRYLTSILFYFTACRFSKSVMQLCGVCSEHVPKYRCPACRIR